MEVKSGLKEGDQGDSGSRNASGGDQAQAASGAAGGARWSTGKALYWKMMYNPDRHQERT